MLYQISLTDPTEKVAPPEQVLTIQTVGDLAFVRTTTT